MPWRQSLLSINRRTVIETQFLELLHIFNMNSRVKSMMRTNKELSEIAEDQKLI